MYMEMNGQVSATPSELSADTGTFLYYPLYLEWHGVPDHFEVELDALEWDSGDEFHLDERVTLQFGPSLTYAGGVQVENVELKDTEDFQNPYDWSNLRLNLNVTVEVVYE